MPLSLATDRRVKNVHSLRSDIVFAFCCLVTFYVCIQALDVLLLIYVSALFAVVASAVVIALVGVAPAWIYAGPILAIVTATGVGVAFLVGNKRSAPAPKA